MKQLPSLLVLAAVVAVFNLHGLFPNAPLAFYVLRGLLGTMAAVMIGMGCRINVAVAAVWAWFEATASVCGVLYVAAPVTFQGQCDAGTGLPVNLLGLTGAVLAEIFTIQGSSTGGNEQENG